MHDLLRDWRRWTPAERFAAAGLAFFAITVPLAVALHAVG